MSNDMQHTFQGTFLKCRKQGSDETFLRNIFMNFEAFKTASFKKYIRQGTQGL